MSHLDKIPAGLRRRIEHRYDAEYFDNCCRDCGWMLHSIVPYGNIEVLREDKARKGFSDNDLVIYLPNHRSLFDFVALGYMFWKLDFKIPRFAAGENLFFGRFNIIWRRLGGYSIDRGNMDWGYRKALVEYVTHLVVEEKADQVDFVGGGRSYDGRLQEPKLGLIGVVWRAAQKIDENVVGQPIFLDYNKVPEDSFFDKLKKYREKGNYKKYIATDIVAFLIHALKQFSLYNKYFDEEIDLKIEFGESFSIKECKSKQELGEKVSMALREMAQEDLLDELLVA